MGLLEDNPSQKRTFMVSPWDTLVQSTETGLACAPHNEDDWCIIDLGEQ